MSDSHFHDDQRPGGTWTLCGRSYEKVLMKHSIPSCDECIDLWRAEGWLFPLPAVVMQDD